MRRHPVLFLSLIAILTLVAVLFIYPKFMGSAVRPWRLGLDLVGGSHLVYRIDLTGIGEGEREAVSNGLRDVIEQRVNLFGVTEPQVFTARSGEEYLLVAELAGISDIREAIRQIGETPFLDFREVRGSGTSTAVVPTRLTGRYLKIGGARLDFDPTTNAPEISFSLNDEGATIFEEITRENVGKPLCIFIDGQPIIPQSPEDSCPRVQSEISGGQARITGGFAVKRAKEIVGRFNAGALPAPITLINQQTVSATLGFDSLKRALFAGAVGTLLIMIFMIFYYGVLGIFADLALLVYVVLTLAVFKAIPVTLTLAGLAGFILTIGMAVDANVLIFERTKEEIKKGISKLTAIEEGFRRAWPSIRDSNVSTILTAVILYYFTSSFIRGFALTLLFGVLMSMFSAITVTRSLLRVFVTEKSKPR